MASARASSSFFSAAAPSPLVVADGSIGSPTSASASSAWACASRARDAAGLAVIGGERHVLDEGELAERPRDLERSGDALPADRVRGEAGDLGDLEADRPGARAQVSGNEVERRALARAIRADETQNLALARCEGNLVDRQKSAEAFGQAIDCKHFQRMA